ALAGHREIDRHEHRLVTGIACPENQLLAKFAVANHVELEPEPASGLGGDALDCGGGGRGQGKGDAVRLRCACEQAFRCPPAGAVDIASRATAYELSRILGQPVAVENKPGAGGNLGGAEAARSAPDGYTLFMTTSGIQAINPALYAKMAFDPNKDLAPVAALVSLNNVLVVHPSVPARTVQDVIALAKK